MEVKRWECVTAEGELLEMADRIRAAVVPSNGTFSSAMSAYCNAASTCDIYESLEFLRVLTDDERIAFAVEHMSLAESVDRNGSRWDMRWLSRPHPVTGEREWLTVYLGVSPVLDGASRKMIDYAMLEHGGFVVPGRGENAT